GPWILDVSAATGIENALRSTAQNEQSLGRQLRLLPFDPLQHAVVGLVAVGSVLRRGIARKRGNHQQQDRQARGHCWSCHRPANCPWRRSINERTPSPASALPISLACSALNSGMGGVGRGGRARGELGREARTASGACSAILRAMASARSFCIPVGTTSCTKPKRKASAAPNSSPVNR